MKDENNHKERGHSQLGASSSERWFNCPASIPLGVGVERTTSVYAEEGTAAHELAEHCLLSDMDAKDCIGITKNGFEVTEEMAEAVQVYLDTIRADYSEDKEIYIEDRFELDWIDKELFGTNDCSILDPFKKLTVYDYKHGAGKPVEAKENPQLLYYALGALQGLEVAEVELVIVQPRCLHPDGPVRRWTTTPERLAEFEKELKDRVNAVNEARQVTGEVIYDFAKSGSHCKFCPATGFCKKMKEETFALACSEFDEVVDNRTYLPEPSNLTPKQLRRVLDGAKLIEEWVKGVREYAHFKAEQGEKIDGYKLVQKRSNRSWISEEAVALDFSEKGDELYTKKLKSPAQLEKIVGKEAVAKYCETKDAGYSLVKSTDKRKEVEIKPLNIDLEFDEIFN